MNVAQVLVLSVTAVACVVVFLVMRYPQLRRPQFQNGRRFSIGFSMVCASVCPWSPSRADHRLGLRVKLTALTEPSQKQGVSTG